MTYASIADLLTTDGRPSELPDFYQVLPKGSSTNIITMRSLELRPFGLRQVPLEHSYMLFVSARDAVVVSCSSS